MWMSDESKNKKRQVGLGDSMLSRGSEEMQSRNMTSAVISPLSAAVFPTFFSLVSLQAFGVR